MIQPQTLNGHVLVKPIGRTIKRNLTGFIPDADPETTPECHRGIVKRVETGKEVRVGDEILYKHFRNIAYNGLELIKYEDIILYGKSTPRKPSTKTTEK